MKRAVAALLLFCVALALAWPRARARGWAWSDLGAPVAGYRLSPPRRGQEHDVVFVASRGDEHIELHVVPKGQWQDVLETPSFGVDFEEPRSKAPDAGAVTRAFAERVRARDPGGLSVDGVPLVRAARLPRPGIAFALCVLAAVLLLGTLPRAALWVALSTLSVGLVLRALHLDLPFAWDQDVQRIQIGASSWSEILAGAGLRDRRPPGLFVLLHAVQVFGQAEWVVRLPALLAGALLPAGLVFALWRARGRIGAAACVAAVVAALSPVLVARSREVSELTLVGLLLVLLAGEATRRSRAAAVLTALCLWLDYLALFAILPAVAMLWWRDRKPPRWLLLGMALGAPSLVLGYRAWMADRIAHDVAVARPQIAWGARSLGEISLGVGSEIAGGVGVALALTAAGLWIWRRSVLSTLAGTMALGLLIAVLALSPFVRMQPYYAVLALPLLLQVVAEAELPVAGQVWIAAAGVAFLVRAAPLLPPLYASGPSFRGFAEEIRRAGQTRVATVAFYDATLLAYELARQEGVTLRVDRIRRSEDEIRVAGLAETLVPLVWTHAPGADPDTAALRRLRALGPSWVLSRPDLELPALDRELARCAVVRETAVARLLSCPADAVPSGR
ncbi:MAG: hypothetical protein KC776_30585 [Myxococcales bacterium]|nr:hypothetical protein [Myxococcales bacterium]MCB9580675.1 hypothetical protein [Polyangiaceae bacterium]